MIAPLLLALLALSPSPDPQAISISAGDSPREARLLGEMSLESSHQRSRFEPLRLTDELRLGLADAPAPLDGGGGVRSDMRQILALILGFVPGFGIGHLIARDRDGFVLFLVIDVVLYVAWGVVGWGFWSPFRFIGPLVWLVVHVFQALDAYSSAGGGQLVLQAREQAVKLVDAAPGRESPRGTTRAFGFAF